MATGGNVSTPVMAVDHIVQRAASPTGAGIKSDFRRGQMRNLVSVVGSQPDRTINVLGTGTGFRFTASLTNQNGVTRAVQDIVKTGF